MISNSISLKSILLFALFVNSINVLCQSRDPRITIVNSSDVICNGGDNGSIIISRVTGGSPPYQYSINGGNAFQPQNRFSNLKAGIYSLIVRDSLDRRSAVVPREITQPEQIVLNFLNINPRCNGDRTGVLTVRTSGGRKPYSYQWSNGSNTEGISGLSAGNYTVEVTDSSGCSATQSIQLTEPAILVATATGTNLNCGNDTSGFVSVNVTGGTPPYFYLWDQGTAVRSQSQNGLPAGTYNVTVTDTNDCKVTSSVTITQQGTAIKYAIGDSTSCGIVYYIDPDFGSENPCESRYLICAFNDLDPAISWYSGIYISTGAIDDKLFDKSNADQIIRIQGDSVLYAANVCAKFKTSDDACADWYLPSKAELELIYINLVLNTANPILGFSDEGYWSSVEKNNRKAWIMDFYDGRPLVNNKANKYHVRAVREFITR